MPDSASDTEPGPRFAEAAQLIRKALREPEFEWQGEFYQIPRTSIRPRPISHPEERFYASSVSPESAEIMAKLGFGILVVMQNEWPKAAESIVNYRAIANSVGYNPPPPIILTNVSCAESREEAKERAMRRRRRSILYRAGNGGRGGELPLVPMLRMAKARTTRGIRRGRT